LAFADLIDQSDPPLIHRAQRFERESLQELFDRCADRLFRLCHALTGAPDDAEAMARRALERALDGLPRFGGDARRFDGWVLRLALTRPRRQLVAPAGLRSGLARLPNRHQELLALRTVAGMETDRMALVLDRSAGDVRRSLVEGLRRLAGQTPSPQEGGLEDFDRALDRVLAGASPAQAASSLTAPAGAVTLLEVARDLARLPSEPPSDHARNRLRTAFLAGGAERRAMWVQRHRVAPMVPGLELRRGARRVSKGLVTLIVALTAFSVGSTIAILSMFAGPTTPTYPIKRFAESALLVVNRDPASRADFELKLASTRSREAEDMAVAGHGDLAVTMMKDRYQMLRAAALDLVVARQRDSRWTDERNRFSSEASQSTTNIQNDLKANHQWAAADQVKRLAQQFQSDRNHIDPHLGSAAPSPPPSS
jgi:DNA-directed RNA polymerase specialized sigma24 family protein